jgi:retron-type reverse transcriptase
VLRAQEFTRQFPWYLKLDVRKYFDSVDHTVLRRLLRQKFKDPVVLASRIVLALQTIVSRSPRTASSGAASR